MIAFIKKQIGSLEANIVNIANEEFCKQIRSLTSVKGIKVTLATSLIISLPALLSMKMPSCYPGILGFALFINSRVPLPNIKGTINRNGDSDLRSYFTLPRGLRFVIIRLVGKPISG